MSAHSVTRLAGSQHRTTLPGVHCFLLPMMLRLSPVRLSKFPVAQGFKSMWDIFPEAEHLVFHCC